MLYYYNILQTATCYLSLARLYPKHYCKLCILICMELFIVMNDMSKLPASVIS